MKAAHLRQGLAAEAAALEHLEDQGLSLLEANFSCQHGEIDLVMHQDQELVFIEVRYRQGKRFGGAVESIDAGKRRRLQRSAEHYLQCHPNAGHQGCRFDVVAVSGDAPTFQIEWIANAFW